MLLAQGVTRPVAGTLPHGHPGSVDAVQQPVDPGANLDSLWQHSSSTWIVAACLVLVLVTIIFLVVLSWYRRRLLSDEEASVSEPWTLDDLRRLRAAGSLTEDEYQRMRAAVIATYRERDGTRDKADSSAENWDWTA